MHTHTRLHALTNTYPHTHLRTLTDKMTDDATGNSSNIIRYPSSSLKIQFDHFLLLTISLPLIHLTFRNLYFESLSKAGPFVFGSTWHFIFEILSFLRFSKFSWSVFHMAFVVNAHKYFIHPATRLWYGVQGLDKYNSQNPFSKATFLCFIGYCFYHLSLIYIIT